MIRKEEQTLADTYGLPEDITSFGKEDVKDGRLAMIKLNSTTMGLAQRLKLEDSSHSRREGTFQVMKSEMTFPFKKYVMAMKECFDTLEQITFREFEKKQMMIAARFKSSPTMAA